MATNAPLEQQIAPALSTVLQCVASGSVLPEMPELQSVLQGLEFFLPSMLAELYPYWKGESLDGLLLSEAKKIDIDKAELRGVCILMSDQAVTPFHIRMQISSCGDQIDWMECRLGKRVDDKGGRERTPWSRCNGHEYSFLQESLKAIDWTYKVTFGDERHSAK